MQARASATEAAKRCSCKPCQPRLALAIERAIREAEKPLLDALRMAVAGNTDLAREVLNGQSEEI